MKFVWGIAVGLIVGVSLGWVVSYVHPNRKAVLQLERYVARVEREKEPYSTIAAIDSIKSIQLIAAGLTNEAMEILSHPLARHYRTYISEPGTNEYRARMREVIDELARTNQIVRASIDRKPALDGMVPIWNEEREDYTWIGIVTNSQRNGEDSGANALPGEQQ